MAEAQRAGFATRSADETARRAAPPPRTAAAVAAVENVRGREVAALEMRVRSLEEERERLLVDLAGATPALNDDATGDEGEGAKRNERRRREKASRRGKRGTSFGSLRPGTSRRTRPRARARGVAAAPSCA